VSDPKQDAVATAVETEVRRIVGDVEREYGSERVYATVRLTWLEKPGELTCWRAVSVTRGEASPPAERMALPDEGGRRG